VPCGFDSRASEPGPLLIGAARWQYSERAVVAIQQLWRKTMGVENE
jgi:hypothetical protein